MQFAHFLLKNRLIRIETTILVFNGVFLVPKGSIFAFYYLRHQTEFGFCTLAMQLGVQTVLADSGTDQITVICWRNLYSVCKPDSEKCKVRP